MGRQVVAGVLFLEHGKRRELGIAQIAFFIRVQNALAEGCLVAAIGPYANALFAHNDRCAGVLAHGQHPAGCDVGILQKVIGDELVVVGGFGIVENRGKLFQVARSQQVVDVHEGLFRQQPQGFGFDRKHVLALEGIDGNQIGCQLAVGCVIGAQRKQGAGSRISGGRCGAFIHRSRNLKTLNRWYQPCLTTLWINYKRWRGKAAGFALFCLQTTCSVRPIAALGIIFQ